jgi:BirA family transcriptional regulator, biotin operon repressor / biotin---[acetyl-CoA-carboxylase] ligase
VFLADAQTAGRGRGGHAWHSPPGENLYLSLIVRPRVPAQAIAPITLAAGAAVAELLAAKIGERAEVAIKWPNDVYAAGKKLAGLLVEGQLRGGDVASLVVGLGVNVHASSFPEEIAARATSLALLGCADRDRSRLAGELCVALGAAVARFEEGRLGPFLGVLDRRDLLRGRAVEIGGVRGIASGIDAEGRLLVLREDGAVVPVVAGEVVFV